MAPVRPRPSERRLFLLASSLACAAPPGGFFAEAFAPSSSLRSSLSSSSSSSSSSSASSPTALRGEGLDTLRDYLKYSDEGVARLVDQRRRGESILKEVESGARTIDPDFIEEEEEEAEDPNVINADDWGQWDERDLEGPNLEEHWDPAVDADPNELKRDEYEYVSEIPKDEDGVELGYDPTFGSWYPIDERTIVNPPESYIVDAKTANATSVPRDFPSDEDVEVGYNADVKAFRKSLKIVETYVDEWTGLEHPRHVAKWHGEPPLEVYPPKPWTNNRFTKDEDRTDFSGLSPYRARKKALELARSKNNEWLPKGMSEAYHHERTKIFEEKGLLVGSLKKGQCDPEVVERIRPALDVLGNVADLLSIQEGVFRFHYHGLIKNKRGMEAWTQTMIRDECGAVCTGVVFETGRRKRDPWYDHGDHWYGPY